MNDVSFFMHYSSLIEALTKLSFLMKDLAFKDSRSLEDTAEFIFRQLISLSSSK